LERAAGDRLVLGTAQLGMAYGVANRTGRPDRSEAVGIVGEAWESGIREFDTAQAYGDSECVLGESLRHFNIADQASVITKFHPSLDHLSSAALENSLQESRTRLGVPRIHGVLLHKEELLDLWHRGLAEICLKLVEKGLIGKVGVSVYSPERALAAIDTEGIDIVQVPTNILDRRFEKAGVFRQAEARNKDVYVRSIFLQGLVLMKPAELRARMSFAAPVVERIEVLAGEFGFTRHEMAVAYIRSGLPGTKVVFGAETRRQVRENIAAWLKEGPPSLLQKIRDDFPDVGERVLSPHLWA